MSDNLVQPGHGNELMPVQPSHSTYDCGPATALTCRKPLVYHSVLNIRKNLLFPFTQTVFIVAINRV